MPIGSPAPGVAVINDLDNIPPDRDRNRFGNGLLSSPAGNHRQKGLRAGRPPGQDPLYNKVENKEKKAVSVGGSGWIKAERQGQ